VARLLRFPAIHGDRVVFTYAGDLYTVPSTGGVARKLTNDVGYEMFARFSPDGKKLAYNQVFREFRTWKRCRGGQADEISIYDFATKQTTTITDNPAQDIIPMWSDKAVYFRRIQKNSKRSAQQGAMNTACGSVV